MFFARTAANRQIPLDAEPNPDGNVIIHEGVAIVLGPLELYQAQMATQVAGIDEPNELYMPHHATCPDGAEWRRNQ